MAFENFPPEIKQATYGMLIALPTAILGRVLAHNHLVRLGRRRLFSRDLIWELPTVVFCAIVGGGVAAYLDLPPLAAHAVVGVTSYFGPRGIEAFILRWIDRRCESGPAE
ncbi:MAG: phage holin family protein [Alphaproteobacteria bacterium]|nr:phage holin family protein [Alphaproteobacteria bacterium]